MHVREAGELADGQKEAAIELAAVGGEALDLRALYWVRTYRAGRMAARPQRDRHDETLARRPLALQAQQRAADVEERS